MRRIGIVVGAASLFITASAGVSVGAPALDPREPTTEPVAAHHPVFERPLIAVAHRGASGHAPENTLAAIDVAHELGAVTVEVDVQLTADGEPVIMHDTTLERTTDVEAVFPDRAPYRVSDFTMAEIRRLDAGGWYDPAFAGEPVPTLGEVLDRMAEHDLNLLLELKEPELYPGLERAVAEELFDRAEWFRRNPPWEPRRLVIQSFDWESVRESQDILRPVPHGLLGMVPEDRIDDYGWAAMINPNHRHIDADYVRRVQEAGMEIMPYTINDRATMDAVLGLGVDGFITDYPEVGREAIDDLDDGDRFGAPVPPAPPVAAND
ncbi:glycerophosphodiester phosphodiesterase [Nocardiopsis sp. EMB25]|uniref:glycerophosphodiester phosphodiesterase n=1 Tax=Nocardiopsis sp. EMB25 TaxID=2835867 RepID=UPI0022833BCA|nr:glycerophosphodiester phosphodiesterase family protein [Nocardiopsis sp. EMB25]MCY9782578.1 glycerophosphodiester phosphodiesterase [Nocardiopsis sp. EMB25]